MLTFWVSFAKRLIRMPVTQEKEEGNTPKKMDTIGAETPKPELPELERNSMRGSTMVISVVQGKTYADVSGKLRKEVNPDSSHSRVVVARATKKGDLLIKIGGDSNKKTFPAEVTKAVEGICKVVCGSKGNAGDP
ncbi:uncharacterized protein LOC122503951 [Leptopilina heterotoma]|uniref:uncharacterized protein LOC122503951 n=1 Tax=Leptopilina heterotoma TaxID=63436 RepID=UPI001CA9D30A|nr:uncharacterized protein LOC122503951 [Leptopilina heterotoma]